LRAQLAAGQPKLRASGSEGGASAQLKNGLLLLRSQRRSSPPEPHPHFALNRSNTFATRRRRGFRALSSPKTKDGAKTMHQMWRLSEAVPQNLGLACTDDGLLLGRTSLVERRDGRFAVRARGEIERLLKCAYDGEPPVDRLMSGLARVASALNANDQCLARIVAVHLQIPDLASAAVRDALAAEDSLIKYARDGGAANWNPALHPRAGTPPNPGWFATTGGASHESPSVRVAENNDPTRRSDASPGAADNWVHLPPAKRIDELGDFLEWLANAKPEDEETIRREINRYWGSAGDVRALGTLNFMLSQVLKPGTTRQDRQQILEIIDNYSRYDPAEVAQFYDQLFDLLALLAGGLSARPRAKAPGTQGPSPAEAKPLFERPPSLAGQLLAELDAAAWKRGWAWRGRYFEQRLGRTLHENFPVIDKIPDGVATSIKSIDLNAATYQNAAGLTGRLEKYVVEVSEFVGDRLGDDVVRLSDIKGRALSLAVPKGSMTATQKAAVENVRRWARMLNNPVDIIINEF
jgi:hypothetical protein